MKKPTSILEQHLAQYRILARQEALAWALKKLGASKDHPVSMHAIERRIVASLGHELRRMPGHPGFFVPIAEVRALAEYRQVLKSRHPFSARIASIPPDRGRISPQ